jgi:DNA modification methylase
MTPTTRTIHGDCLDVMAEMEPNSIDAIMTDPIQATIKERTNHCGPFTSHAEITQQLKGVISIYVRRKPVKFLEFDQQEALDMICHKIGRILNGDPNYADSWHDIAGYAQLVADRLNEVSP